MNELIIRPPALPTHERDLWQAAFAAAFACQLKWSTESCARQADRALRAYREVCRQRAEAACSPSV